MNKLLYYGYNYNTWGRLTNGRVSFDTHKNVQIYPGLIKKSFVKNF